jgi:hypothetical protein
MTAAPRTFGVEIECLMPSGTTRSMLAAKLRDAGLQANAFGYDHNTRPGWKLTTDGSVGDEHTGMEAVSPVLSGEAGRAEAAKVADILREAGCTVNKECGLHVHVFAGDLDLKQMKKLAINFVHSETAFDAIVPPSRRKDENTYIQSNRTAFGGSYENEGINKAIAAFEAAPDMNTLIHRVSNVSNGTPRQQLGERHWREGRYRKLNFMPMLRFKTVEFRQHAGTVEGEKITNWVQLCVAFVERSMMSRPRPRTSTAAHVASAELGALLYWLRLTPDACKYFRGRRKEFSNRTVERAAARAAESARQAEAARLAAWEAGAAERAVRQAEASAAEARREEENNRRAAERAARLEQAERERAEARRIEQARYFAERRAAAEAALAAARGTNAAGADDVIF